MLDFDPTRVAVAPRPAATLLLLRDRLVSDSTHRAELEVCVMQRSKQSSFMGGAVVFPGGRIEPADAASEWDEVVERGSGAWLDWWDDEGRAARIAACREALEEVGLAPIPGVTREQLDTLRRAVTPAAFLAVGCRLDLGALVPFARWVTPEAESRRFDARFFLAAAPPGVEPVSDEHEAVRVLYETPRQLLTQFERDEISLFPPTHRSLELLASVTTVAEAFNLARTASLEVICPRFLVEDGAPVLALPGDPQHEIREPRIAGGSRYMLREGRWTSGDAPP